MSIEVLEKKFFKIFPSKLLITHTHTHILAGRRRVKSFGLMYLNMPLKKVDFIEEWYKIFLKNTDEKDILTNKIKDLLVGKDFSSGLEIGLGISPYFAKSLSGLFKKYTIIEKRLVEAKMPKGVDLINTDWEDVKLDQKFDIIIASHVIYYFNDKQAAIAKMFEHLNERGIIFFVVNGKTADYGSLKLAFANIIKDEYKFTYDELLEIIKGKEFIEYTVPSTINFKNYNDLFETLKISFDMYPEEYKAHRDEIINYLSQNIKGKKFIIDQKILKVQK